MLGTRSFSIFSVYYVFLLVTPFFDQARLTLGSEWLRANQYFGSVGPSLYGSAGMVLYHQGKYWCIRMVIHLITGLIILG